jgi:secondary thiamine-phosphate synthase enzyme
MRQASHRLSVATRGKGLYDVTDRIDAWLAGRDIGDGLLNVFIRHTSASLVIQENADPDVLHDLETFFAGLVPESRGQYLHRSEGPDDMPAHIRAALTQTHLCIPVIGGRLALGTWQAVYLYEHRAAPHDRELALHLIGS